MKAAGIAELAYFKENGGDLFVQEAGAASGLIDRFIAFFKKVWEKIKAHPVDFTGQSAIDLIQAEIHQAVEGKVRDLADTWCADVEDIKFHAYHYKETDDLMDLKLNYQAYKERGGALFKLLYLSTAREEIKKAIRDKIQPLLAF